uniref:Putative secreted protein n=1 Tax=Anopheles triannulatus TaxID=58253 RepID=A0A2M4B7E7_9DIPT
MSEGRLVKLVLCLGSSMSVCICIEMGRANSTQTKASHRRCAAPCCDAETLHTNTICPPAKALLVFVQFCQANLFS